MFPLVSTKNDVCLEEDTSFGFTLNVLIATKQINGQVFHLKKRPIQRDQVANEVDC